MITGLECYSRRLEGGLRGPDRAACNALCLAKRCSRYFKLALRNCNTPELLQLIVPSVQTRVIDVGFENGDDNALRSFGVVIILVSWLDDIWILNSLFRRHPMCGTGRYMRGGQGAPLID